MNKKIIITSILLIIGTLLFAQPVTFSAKDINNNIVTDSVFSNSKVTMVNVWGTFCGPCIREMPDLGTLSKTYDSNDFQIIGIVIDSINNKGETIPKVVKSAKKIVKKTSAEYIHIVPDDKLLNGILEDISLIPTTFFVDSTGSIIDSTYIGARSMEEWQEIIDSLLK